MRRASVFLGVRHPSLLSFTCARPSSGYGAPEGNKVGKVCSLEEPVAQQEREGHWQ